PVVRGPTRSGAAVACCDTAHMGAKEGVRCELTWVPGSRLFGEPGNGGMPCRRPEGARGEPMARQSLPGAGGPDPGRIASPQDFGRELSLARQQAGLTIREAARASGIPVSTAGDYFTGRHLPPARPPELLARLLAACGITDPGQVERWQEALNRVRRTPGRRPASGPAPYRGLASFQPEDAAWFFGPEGLALHLVRLAAGPGSPGLPLAVVGPSGSGKSSLLRAGLVPRLRAATPARPGGRPVVLITPGASPVDALAAGLAPLALRGPERPLQAGPVGQGLRENPGRYARLTARGDEPPAIIVDQLEEIFTAGAGETSRQEFVGALAALSEHTLVVAGLRTDFYGHALSYPALARSLQERQIVVGPMSLDQLLRAIVAPAHKAGLDSSGGLVEVLLADMRPYGPAGPGAGGHEAGALPLLSHALLATWEHSRGGRLTVADYQASGGVRGAVAPTPGGADATLGTGRPGVARPPLPRPGPPAGRRPAFPAAGPRRRRRPGTPGPPAAHRPARGRQRRRRSAGALRRAAPGHHGPGRGRDHPRGPARRLAPAAGVDRHQPRGHQGP